MPKVLEGKHESRNRGSSRNIKCAIGAEDKLKDYIYKTPDANHNREKNYSIDNAASGFFAFFLISRGSDVFHHIPKKYYCREQNEKTNNSV